MNRTQQRHRKKNNSKPSRKPEYNFFCKKTQHSHDYKHSRHHINPPSENGAQKRNPQISKNPKITSYTQDRKNTESHIQNRPNIIHNMRLDIKTEPLFFKPALKRSPATPTIRCFCFPSHTEMSLANSLQMGNTIGRYFLQTLF